MLAAVVMGLAAPAMAARYRTRRQGTQARVSISGFELRDNTLNDMVGTGIGLSVDLPLRMGQSQGETAVTLGVMSASGTIDSSEIGAAPGIQVELTDTIYSIMLTKRYGPGVTTGRGPYLGTGAGLAHTRLHADFFPDTASAEENDFIFQLFAGIQFSSRSFGEIRYFNGQDDANTGFAIAVGKTF